MKKDYFLMIGELNDGFGDNGWADGYANIPSKHEEILKQLYRKIPNEELINYLDISIKDNKKIYNKLTKFYDDKKELPYITIGTERIYNYSDTVYYIKYPVDKEYNLVDIVKKDNELPILKQPISDSGSYYEE